MSEQWRDEEWTYLGRRTSGAKLAYAWQGPDGDLRAFSKQVAPAAIGQVYRIHTDGQSVRTAGEHGPKYLRQGGLPKQEAIDAYAADAAAAAEQVRKAVNTKAAKAGAPLDPILAEVRTAVSGMTRNERRAVAAIILEAVYL